MIWTCNARTCETCQFDLEGSSLRKLVIAFDDGDEEGSLRSWQAIQAIEPSRGGAARTKSLIGAECGLR